MWDEVRFDYGGQQFLLVDAWRGPSDLDRDAIALDPQDALWTLSHAVRWQPRLERDALGLAERVLDASAPGFGVRSQARTLEALERALASLAPRLALYRIPRVKLMVPTPPELPKQDGVEQASELSFIEFEIVNQTRDPIPFLDYELDYPEPNLTAKGKLDRDGYLYVGDIPHGNYTLRLPEIAYPFEPDDNHAHVIRITGMCFDTNKCFLLPDEATLRGLKRLVHTYNELDGGELLVVGHTDTTGEPAINDPLSLERAKSVVAFLTDDVDAWLAWYGESVPAKKRWSASEDAAMFTRVGGGQAMSTANIKRYQTDHGLNADGIIGPKTRKQLITDYMAADGTSLPSSIRAVAHGCGESFPALGTGNGVTAQGNRRVELFFFEQTIDPAPSADISSPGSTEYAKWNERVVQQSELGAQPPVDLGRLAVRLVQDVGLTPLPNTSVRLEAQGTVVFGATNEDGVFEHAERVTAGVYSLHVMNGSIQVCTIDDAEDPMLVCVPEEILPDVPHEPEADELADSPVALEAFDD